MKTLRLAAAVAAVSTLFYGGASLAALEARLDQFTIYRNGSVFANDTFSNGVSPPQGEGTFGSGGSAMTYFTQGTFTESGGKLFMNSQTQGAPRLFSLQNANNGATIFTGDELVRVHTGRALTNAMQTNPTAGLKRGIPFEVLGLFDLVPPTTRSANYGIGFADNFSTSSPQFSTGPTFDRMRLSVIQPTNASLAPRIQFWRNDQTTNPDQNIIFGHHALDPNHSQIVLRLSHSNTPANEITASYAYVDGPHVGLDIANPANLGLLSFNSIANTIGQSTAIFNDYIHTRGEFRQLARDDDQRFDFARLTTGSPVSMSQDVTTGSSPVTLSFNYRFDTTSGTFSAMLGSTLLDTITAPAAFTTEFSTASYLISEPALLNATLPLTFTFDGPAGSQILLDEVVFGGTDIGNFQSGLTAWDVSGPGSAGVLTVTAAVPEPSTYALMLAGLGMVAFVAKRRRRANPAITPVAA